MASTLANLLYHVVFSTKNRRDSISDEIRDDLHRYMGGIIKGENGILLEIGGTPDHVHLVLKLKPVHTLSDMMRKLKGGSSKWMNENNKTRERFTWQDGYGAFSVSRSQLEHVRQYVKEQEEHHRTFSFRYEYIRLLELHGVEYNDDFLW